MGTLVGSKKQEEKISELGAIANQMFPNVKTKVFKGTFRFGIRSALEKTQFQSWEEIAEQPPMTRKKFFQNVLDESLPHLKTIGLNREEADMLISRLRKENEKYLKRKFETSMPPKGGHSHLQLVGLIERMPPDSANEDACAMRDDECQQLFFQEATFFLTSQVFLDIKGNETQEGLLSHRG